MKAVKKKKSPVRKSNFCEQVASRPKVYQTSGLAVRKFEWRGTTAVPSGASPVPTQFNRNLGKPSSRPKSEQTVSLNSDGTPDLKRIREQTERKGSKPTE